MSHHSSLSEIECTVTPPSEKKHLKRWKVQLKSGKGHKGIEGIFQKTGKGEDLSSSSYNTGSHIQGMSRGFLHTSEEDITSMDIKYATVSSRKSERPFLQRFNGERSEKLKASKRTSMLIDRKDLNGFHQTKYASVQQLWVKLISVKNLFKKVPKDIFCKIGISDSMGLFTNQGLKTSTLNKQNDLIWNETIIFFYENFALSEILIEIYEEEFLGKQTLLGHCQMNLGQLRHHQVQEHTLQLIDCTGTVHLKTNLRTLSENTATTDLYGFGIHPDQKEEYDQWWSVFAPKSEEKLRDWIRLQWYKIKPSELKAFLRKGIPSEYRGEMWQILSGSKTLLKKNEDYYSFTLKEHFDEKTIHTIQIDKDLDRTFPGHAVYRTPEGIEALRRVLVAFSWKNQSVGYCQSMNFICGLLLLFLEEEAVFWLLSIITEELVPDYFNLKMFGAKADICVFKEISTEKIPNIVKHLNSLEIEVSHVIAQWFLCLYVGYLPTETVLRVFDVFLLEGSSVLIRIALALFKLNEAEILASTDFDEVFQILKRMPTRALDCNKLLKVAFKEFGYLPAARLRSLRQRHYKLIEDTSNTKTIQQLTKTTNFTTKELEALSYQYNSTVQITPDNKNRLMDKHTFFELFEGMFRVSYPEKTSQKYDLLHLIFNALDQNKDKNIDFQDFISALFIFKRGTHSQKIELVFSALDTEGKGFIEREDLRTLLQLQDLFPMDDQLIDLFLQEHLPSEKDRMKVQAFTQVVENNQTLLTWILQSTTLLDSA